MEEGEGDEEDCTTRKIGRLSWGILSNLLPLSNFFITPI